MESIKELVEGAGKKYFELYRNIGCDLAPISLLDAFYKFREVSYGTKEATKLHISSVDEKEAKRLVSGMGFSKKVEIKVIPIPEYGWYVTDEDFSICVGSEGA